MENSFRYKMQNIGDIVVDYLKKGYGGVKSRSMGITITFKIKKLNKKRQKVFTKIGARLGEIHKTSPKEAIFEDEKMMALFAKLKEIDDRIGACKRKREERLYPGEFASEKS